MQDHDGLGIDRSQFHVHQCIVQELMLLARTHQFCRELLDEIAEFGRLFGLLFGVEETQLNITDFRFHRESRLTIE